MGRSRRLPKSREEKVAEQITQLLEPISINLDEVGINIARMNNVHYNRLLIVTESAEWEKTNAYDQENVRG
jgi:hypothetical protein